MSQTHPSWLHFCVNDKNTLAMNSFEQNEFMLVPNSSAITVRKPQQEEHGQLVTSQSQPKEQRNERRRVRGSASFLYSHIVQSGHTRK